MPLIKKQQNSRLTLFIINNKNLNVQKQAIGLKKKNLLQKFKKIH